jgi:pyruvate kinase
MPSEAAEDGDLVHALLSGGMDVMRVNCAHDSPDAWARMVSHLERARSKVGRGCRVLMDIAGPKLRTGPMAPGPRVLKWRPRRDVSGRVTAAAKVWLHPAGQEAGRPPVADAALPVPEAWLSRLQVRDRIDFTDLRGKARRLRVTGRQEGGCWAESEQTAYVGPETALRHRGAKGQEEARRAAEAPVGDLPPLSQTILLKPGDTLVLTRDLTPGVPAVRDEAGQIVEAARIGCTLPEVFTQVRRGESVWFDDGKLGGTITAAAQDSIHVQVTHAAPQGTRIGPDKGINLPDSKILLPPLTPKDLEDLRFIAAHADLLGLSFVRRPEDVREIEAQLAKDPDGNLGIVLKIETRQGFEQLPPALAGRLRQAPGGRDDRPGRPGGRVRL